MTLQRAKAMLEQSHVPIAGVIVNSLSEDVQNWSSYGYDGASAGSPRRGGPGLPAPRGAGSRMRKNAVDGSHGPGSDRPIDSRQTSSTRAGVIAP